jgi:hypothetical protein
MCVRACMRILFNFRPSHYDEKSMFSFQKVQTSLYAYDGDTGVSVGV